MYIVKYDKKVEKQLKKMDRFQARILFDWIENNLVGTDNPRKFGKSLTDNRAGEWRYRVGNYRILAIIKDDELIISIIEVGHRKEIYQ